MSPLRKVFPALVAAAVAMGGAGKAEAQVITLPFMSPQTENSLGLYLSDFGDLTLEGIARGDLGGFNLGVRGGIVDVGDDTGITIGGELRNPLELGTAPIDLAFTAGIQALLGDLDGIGVQAGLTFGHTFVPEQGTVRFTPYLHPRIAYADYGGGDGDVELLADVGFDLDFGTNLSLRFGANLGDGADWGIGLAWR